ncbi:MAG TPA: AmmeMemoRadiSam system protein B [Bryobacteraceae bacterium]|nr:AmmeMemoRadiSam system protein B [Bryobacteraceae bacterium]
MPHPLPRLRNVLDIVPSPAPDRPGLFIRDPYRYSDAMLIIPPPLIECLRCFDGRQTDLDLRSLLVRITGDLQVGELEKHLIETFSSAGFLEDEAFAQMKAGRQREFAEAPKREPAHAGGAYPLEIAALRETMARYMDGALPSRSRPAPSGKLCGIAAPHVSPEGGWQSYRAAYGALGPELKDRTFVILATSHYGTPEHFGLTRKPFVTPLGETATDTALVDRLAADGGPAVLMEDYCHSFEHTVELQLIFLQHIYGPDIRILPILCGQYAHSLYRRGAPEADEGVRRFLGSLGEMAAREGDSLFWILGIDMAHMGARYQDDFPAYADQGAMAEVAERDRQRIARVAEWDGDGFWSLVQENHDDLKWCGSAPLYTFLKTLPGARGELLRYEQWNIDPRSVVSFAGMAFSKP